MQNVSQTSKHRGSSVTIVNSGGGVNLGSTTLTLCSGIPGSNNGGSQTTSMLVMEEHAVMPEPSFSSTVTVYDALGLFPVSKELACKYK